MLRQIFVALLFILYSSALAAGFPTNTEITPKNAEAYSIELKQIGSGSPDVVLYQLEFSGKLEKCSAGRVQTSLFIGENEISSSSMDYKVGSSPPSVLLHMPASGYDMAITLQYCCMAGLSPGCKRSLSIKSVKAFVAE
ncbi:hypothetical protein [uncultured Gilvimarinus sp.]|uniref:hypothetical protein n=1 Tax=uncultured Gilvimarinus sp. TaxID=1689143 RepID=UPI0030EE28BB|tara:strand:+ start:152 stop:568 length:417 start_codon:yes stop_codon:yes gene_type:complete